MTQAHSLSPEPSAPAPYGIKSFALGLLVALLFVVFDQWTKARLYDWLTGTEITSLVRDVHGHERHLVSGEWLSFMSSCNPGAAFGQFRGMPVVLVVGRVLACGFLIYMLAKLHQGQRVVQVAIVLVLSGALGNVIDNLWTGCGSESFPYGVRDFLAVWFEPLVGWDYHFPSFNVADSCIFVGALIWICSGLSSSKANSDGSESVEPG